VSNVRSAEPNGTEDPANLRTRDPKLGSLCIALDVRHENVEMGRHLDWEILNRPCGNHVLARLCGIAMIPHRMGVFRVTQRQEMLIPPSSFVGARMPMIRHQMRRKDAQ